MIRLQIYLIISINRRRRKKEIINIYWAQITERLRYLFSKGGNNVLKKFGGTKILHAVESAKRKQIIYDYIVQNEREYSEAMVSYNQMLVGLQNRQERVISKILAYFVKRQILERTFDTELDIIEKQIEAEIPLPDNAKNKDLDQQIDKKRRLKRQLKKT